MRAPGRAPAHGFERRARSLRTLAVAAAVGIGAATAATGLGSGLERSLQAGAAELSPRAASGRVALVEIDARSLADAPRWPWPRGVYGRAVEAVARAGGTLAAFDIDVSAASTPDQDGLFAAAIARSPIPVVLPVFAQASSQGRGRRLENAPIAPLRERAQLAAVNIAADADGTVRTYPYGMVAGGLPRPSMAATLAGVSGAAGASFPVNAAIDPATLPRFSFEDLLAGRLPRGALKGRSVLVGATAIELGDRYPTPTHGVLPGALIQALAADTLIQGAAAGGLGPAAALLAAAAALLAMRRLRRRARSLALVGLGAALLDAPAVLERLRWPAVEVVPALVATGAAALLFAAVSAASAVRRARLVDAATGLPNGRALAELLAQDRARGSASGGVLTLRVRGYPDLVAALGARAAGEAVAKLAERVRFATGADVHRVEGDALAWPEPADGGEAGLVERVDALAGVLRPPVELGGRFVDMTCAFGFADGGDGPEQAASRSLLAAGRALDRNTRLEFSRTGWTQESALRVSLSADFERALADGDLWVAYQPKLDIATGEVGAVEALVRWRHPEHGALPPDDFIPLLEAGGRIPALTLHVFRCVLRDLEAWAAQGVHLSAAVNVSALLPADGEFMAALGRLLAASPTPPSRITAEVTESAALADPERAADALRRLTALGVRVSIDDYGAGQSTLSYLRNLPASEIKIDKSFVTNLVSSRNDQVMVRSTIDLAHQLGLKVVAEGVETTEVLEMLRAYGCDGAQGWLVGRPMPGAELLARLGAGVGAPPVAAKAKPSPVHA